MQNEFAAPTVRVSDGSKDGFVVINAADFDLDQHKLFDKADADLVPPRAAKGKAGDTADVKELRKQLATAEAHASEAESALEEMKVRAEAAEAELAKLADGKKQK